MKRHVLIATLVVLSALPVVAASGGSDFDVTHVDATTAPAQSQSTAAATSQSSGSASQADDGAEWNYTELYVDAANGHLQLKPGESEEFTITVGNREADAVTVNPHVHQPPTGQNLINSNWVSVDGDTTIAPDEESEFTVTVSVPDDAEIGRYDGMIAFTDEQITYPGRPPRPVHAAHVGVEVWTEPTVKISSDSYVHGQVEAGEQVTHEFEIENTGTEPVPLSPELANQHRHCRGSGCPAQLDPSWLSIDAPSEIGAGETATVTVRMAPDTAAERGRYDTELDLGLKDPARPDRNPHWQQVQLRYVVWKQPSEPFATTVDVSDRTQNLTLTLSPRATTRPGATSGGAEQPSFDVTFVSPDGTTVDAERVRVTDRGSVDLSGRERRGTSAGEYAVSDGGTEFVYRVANPPAGNWTVRVMPHHTIGFTYELDRSEADR